MTKSMGTSAIALSGLLAVAFLLSVFVGESDVSLANALSSPTSRDGAIFFAIRLPRAMLAVLAGASLAFSGAALQSLLRNPLADPFILGVSGGAALGATSFLALGTSSLSGAFGAMCAWGLPTEFAATCASGASSILTVLCALLGAGVATVAVFASASPRGALSPVRALLAGVVFNALASAAITFIKAISPPGRLGELTHWLSGNIPLATWGGICVLALAVIVSFVRVFALSHTLNLLGLGDVGASVLGVDVASVRRKLFLWLSVAVASVVAFTGMIGFVGLIAPHLVRKMVGGDNRRLIPLSALLGASCLLLADLAARLLLPLFGTVPPVGALTALAGAPFFLSLLKKNGDV